MLPVILLEVTEFADFLETVKQWSSTRPDVCAVLLVGSYARGDAHDGSDLDIVVVTTLRDSYLSDWTLLPDLGRIERTRAEDWGAAKTLRIWVEGTEYEWNFVEPSWLSVPLDPGTQSVLKGGYVILHKSPGFPADAITSAL